MATTLGGQTNGATVSLGLDWSDTVTTSGEIKFEDDSKNDLKVQAPGADGINHDEDKFYLWLNPIIQVSVQGKKLVYAPAVDGPSMDIVYLYPPQLRDPSTITGDLATRLAARGFTADDYKQILAANPLANGSTTINTARYLPTWTTFPYEPPENASDGPTIQTYTVSTSRSVLRAKPKPVPTRSTAKYQSQRDSKVSQRLQ